MKSALSISLLILLVSIQTPLGQLLKLPLLVEHFIRHQNKEGTSFFGFLQSHYSGNHKDADLPEDEQLPFKTICLYSIDYAVIPASNPAGISHVLNAIKKIIFPDFFIPQKNASSIFHPPDYTTPAFY